MEAIVVINAALALGQGLLRIYKSVTGKPSKGAKRELTDVLENMRSLQKKTTKIKHKDPALEALKENLTNWIKKAQELLKKSSLTEEDVRELQRHQIKAFEILDSQVKLCSKIYDQESNAQNHVQINYNTIIIHQHAPSQYGKLARPSTAGAIGSSRSNHIKGPGNQRIRRDIKGKAASGLISKGHHNEGKSKPRDNYKGERKPEKQKCTAHEKGKDKEKEKEKKQSTTAGSKRGTHKS